MTKLNTAIGFIFTNVVNIFTLIALLKDSLYNLIFSFTQRGVLFLFIQLLLIALVRNY